MSMDIAGHHSINSVLGTETLLCTINNETRNIAQDAHTVLRLVSKSRNTHLTSDEEASLEQLLEVFLHVLRNASLEARQFLVTFFGQLILSDKTYVIYVAPLISQLIEGNDGRVLSRILTLLHRESVNFISVLYNTHANLTSPEDTANYSNYSFVDDNHVKRAIHSYWNLATFIFDSIRSSCSRVRFTSKRSTYVIFRQCLRWVHAQCEILYPPPHLRNGKFNINCFDLETFETFLLGNKSADELLVNPAKLLSWSWSHSDLNTGSSSKCLNAFSIRALQLENGKLIAGIITRMYREGFCASLLLYLLKPMTWNPLLHSFGLQTVTWLLSRKPRNPCAEIGMSVLRHLALAKNAAGGCANGNNFLNALKLNFADLEKAVENGIRQNNESEQVDIRGHDLCMREFVQTKIGFEVVLYYEIHRLLHCRVSRDLRIEAIKILRILGDTCSIDEIEKAAHMYFNHAQGSTAPLRMYDQQGEQAEELSEGVNGHYFSSDETHTLINNLGVVKELPQRQLTRNPMYPGYAYAEKQHVDALAWFELGRDVGEEIRPHSTSNMVDLLLKSLSNKKEVQNMKSSEHHNDNSLTPATPSVPELRTSFSNDDSRNIMLEVKDDSSIPTIADLKYVNSTAKPLLSAQYLMSSKQLLLTQLLNKQGQIQKGRYSSTNKLVEFTHQVLAKLLFVGENLSDNHWQFVDVAIRLNFKNDGFSTVEDPAVYNDWLTNGLGLARAFVFVKYSKDLMRSLQCSQKEKKEAAPQNTLSALKLYSTLEGRQNCIDEANTTWLGWNPTSLYTWSIQKHFVIFPLFESEQRANEEKPIKNNSLQRLFQLILDNSPNFPEDAQAQKIFIKVWAKFLLDIPYIPSVAFAHVWDWSKTLVTGKLAFIVLTNLVKYKQQLTSRRTAFTMLCHLLFHSQRDVRRRFCTFVSRFFYQAEKQSVNKESGSIMYETHTAEVLDTYTAQSEGMSDALRREIDGWRQNKYCSDWLETLTRQILLRSERLFKLSGMFSSQSTTTSFLFSTDNNTPPYLEMISDSVVSQIADWIQSCKQNENDSEPINNSKIGSDEYCSNLLGCLTDLLFVLCSRNEKLIRILIAIYSQMNELTDEASAGFLNIFSARIKDTLESFPYFHDIYLDLLENALKNEKEGTMNFVVAMLQHGVKQYNGHLVASDNNHVLVDTHITHNVQNCMKLIYSHYQICLDERPLVPLIGFFTKRAGIMLLSSFVLALGDSNEIEQAMINLIGRPKMFPAICIEAEEFTSFSTLSTDETTSLPMYQYSVSAEDILFAILDLNIKDKSQRRNQAKALDLFVKMSTTVHHEAGELLLSNQTFTAAFNRVVEDKQNEIPAIFGRLLCKVAQHIPTLRDFIISRILPKLFERQIWEDSVLWQGCKIAISILWVDGCRDLTLLFFHLSQEQTEDILSYLKITHPHVMTDIATFLTTDENAQQQCPGYLKAAALTS